MTDTLWIIKDSLDAANEVRILEEIFKNKPYMSKLEAVRLFGSEVHAWIRNETVPFKSKGSNQKWKIPVKALIQARAASRVDRTIKESRAIK